MSKKKHRRSPEIPQVGNALEVPNYVIPMTDLEYKQTVEETREPAEAQSCGGQRSCTENCGKNCGENCCKDCKN